MNGLSRTLIAVSTLGLLAAAGCGTGQNPPNAQPATSPPKSAASAPSASSSSPSSSSSSTSTASTASTAPQPAAQTSPVKVTMKILTNGKLKGQDQPRFTNPSWTQASGAIRVGNTVQLTIVSYDDGAAPPPAGFDKVKGTVGGTETVAGTTVSTVNLKDIAHTFTITGLGVNIPIPAAPTGGSVTVTASIPLTKAGTFDWQCFSPCGSGTGGWGGAMATEGWMRGVIKIAS